MDGAAAFYAVICSIINNNCHDTFSIGWWIILINGYDVIYMLLNCCSNKIGASYEDKWLTSIWCFIMESSILSNNCFLTSFENACTVYFWTFINLSYIIVTLSYIIDNLIIIVWIINKASFGRLGLTFYTFLCCQALRAYPIITQTTHPPTTTNF